MGSITKTGNSHARRLLVEAAWHHRTRYTPGKVMRDRWELAPPAARARGDLGNRRLHHRWIDFNLRRKRPVIANVGIARELAGWCWSLAVMDDLPHKPLRHGTVLDSSAWRDPRSNYEQQTRKSKRRSTLGTRSAPAEQPVLR